MNEEQLANKIASLLNEALALDHEGFSKMIIAKHIINKNLANHETIQCGTFEKKTRTLKQHGTSKRPAEHWVSTDKVFGLSTLGLLNGLINQDWVVAAVVNDQDAIEEFIVMPIPYAPCNEEQ
jgi:hypothetical protein